MEKQLLHRQGKARQGRPLSSPPYAYLQTAKPTLWRIGPRGNYITYRCDGLRGGTDYVLSGWCFMCSHPHKK